MAALLVMDGSQVGTESGADDLDADAEEDEGGHAHDDFGAGGSEEFFGGLGVGVADVDDTAN